jgi:hypothetical protein
MQDASAGGIASINPAGFSWGSISIGSSGTGVGVGGIAVAVAVGGTAVGGIGADSSVLLVKHATAISIAAVIAMKITDFWRFISEFSDP